MRNMFLVFAVFFLTSSSCNQKELNGSKELQTKIEVEENFITICVDQTLLLDSGLNSGTYIIDASEIKSLHKESITRFCEHRQITVGILDSLVRSDSTWIKYGFFQNPVISLKSVEKGVNGLIIVHTSKVKSADGSMGTELILRRSGNNYKCIQSRITWIS